MRPNYWAYARDSLLADVAADLVGPDVAFHHSKLNFKWARGGAEVKWHQDIQYWPHTNYTPLTFGTYLYDCGTEQGPLGVLPGSHKGPLYDLYAEDDTWAGALSDRDAAALDNERTVYLPGPAGSVTIHNCRTAHHSAANDSPIGRPLLLNVYKAADALPYTANPLPCSHAEEMVRGQRALGPPRPASVPRPAGLVRWLHQPVRTTTQRACTAVDVTRRDDYGETLCETSWSSRLHET